MSTTPPPARRTRRQGSTESTPVGLKGKLKIGKYIMGDTLGKERGVGWGEGEEWGEGEGWGAFGEQLNVLHTILFWGIWD